MNEFLTTFHSHANMIDYCEDFIHTEKHDGVFLDRTRFEQTGEDVVFSADSEAELIYCTNGLLGFCLTVYAESISSETITAFISKDGENYESCELDSHLNEYAITQTSQGIVRFEISSRNTFAFGYRYLKICFRSESSIGKIALFTYNHICGSAPFDMELEHTLNVKESSEGYCFAGRFPQAIHLYHDDIMAVAFKVVYQGSYPDVKLTSSVDGSEYHFCTMAATEPITTNTGWCEYYVYHSNCLEKDTRHVKLHFNKGDNEGDNFYITEMYTAVGTFCDRCEDVGDLLFWSPELKQVQDKGFRGFGLYKKGTFFTVNKNDITGFCFDVRMQQDAAIKISVSNDGNTFVPVTYRICDIVEHNNNFVNPNATHIYCCIRNAAPIPADMDYLRFELAEDGPYAEVERIRIEGDNSRAEELAKICRKKNREFADIFSIAHVGGSYSHTEKPYMTEGMDLIKKLGGRSINIWFGSAEDHTRVFLSHFNTQDIPGVHTLIDVINTPEMKALLGDRQLNQIIFNLYTKGDIVSAIKQFDEISFAAYLENEYHEIYDFCCHLIDICNGTGKKIIIQTWESDWWCREGDGYRRSTLDRFAQVMNTRQDAVDAARSGHKPEQFALYNAIEVVDMRSAMVGKDCVTTYVLPQTHCDMYSYSAYQTAITEHDFKESLAVFRKYAPPSKLLGYNNLYIGEMGIPENENTVKNVHTNLIKGYKTLVLCDMNYGVMWQTYCNEPIDRSEIRYSGSHVNNHYRGFWLIRADGTKTPFYYDLKMALKQRLD